VCDEPGVCKLLPRLCCPALLCGFNDRQCLYVYFFQRGQRGRQCRQAAVETQSLNGPSAGGAANTVWPPPGRRELLGAARDLQAGSGAGRRRVGSLEVEDIVSREREACIEDQAARTRHGGDLCAAYLQPDAGEEVPHGRPASWLHHAAHCGPAQCAGD